MDEQKTILVLSVVALVLQIIAVSTNHWSVRKESGDVSLEMSMGLWKFCAEGSKGDNNLVGCKHLPPEGDRMFPKNSLYAVRIFSILGIILTLCALECGMHQHLTTHKQMLCLTAGGVASLIAMAIWAQEMLQIQIMGPVAVEFHPGYSFYAILIAGICALVGAYKLHVLNM